MLSVESGTAAGEAGAVPPRRRTVRAIVAVLGLAALLLFGGFLWYVRQMPVAEVAASRGADGIVVLTGAAFRISDALDLLAAGLGRRLLISGVNPTTRSHEISRLMPERQRWFDCCVDLDHSAINTIGNAIETRRWANDRGFRSLIVVTSNFHMPRAMAELAHQLPDVELVPFPVISDKVRVESWWSNPSTARLLFGEYLKYLVARARMWLETTFD